MKSDYQTTRSPLLIKSIRYMLKLAFCLTILALLSVGPGELLAQTSGQDLFVSSRNTNSIKRYDGQTGEFIGDFVFSRAGGLSAPQEVLWGYDGHLLVTGRGNSVILKYHRDTGAFLGAFTSGYSLDNPTKMTFGPDSLLYVSQWGQTQNKVARFDGQTGVFIDEFTEIGFNQPCGHAWDDAGNLYVASFGSRDVRRFDREGKLLGVFNQGRFGGFVNLWFGDGGDLFVIDWNAGAILRFNGQTGQFIEVFVSGMQNSEGFTFGPDSLLYVCDWSRNRVNQYGQGGQFLQVFANGGNMVAPNSVIFGPPELQTSVEEQGNAAPADFELLNSYPNPFNPVTTIAFTLPRTGRISLKIFDRLGNEVARLVDGVLEAGQHRIDWHANDLPSGVYLYELRSGTFAETKKLTLVK